MLCHTRPPHRASIQAKKNNLIIATATISEPKKDRKNGSVPLHPTFTPYDGGMPRIFCPITPNTYKQCFAVIVVVALPFTSYERKRERKKLASTAEKSSLALLD